MKKITKFIDLLCILLVVFTFAACNPSSNNINNQEGNNSNGSTNQENNNSIVQSGYSISGGSFEPTTPFWCRL